MGDRLPQWVLLLWVFSVFLALPACQSSHTSQSIDRTVQASPGLQPRLEQIRKRYPPETYLLGVGQARSEQAALELARADLVKKLRVHVATLSSDLVRERDGQVEQDISRVVVTRSGEWMDRIRILEQGREPESGLAYAIVAMSSEDVARLRSSDRAARRVPGTMTSGQQPDEPIWVIAEGVVPFGSDTTLAEAAARSRTKARRLAVEKAVGTFVSAQTVIYNSDVAENLVRSVVKGIVIEEQVLDRGVRRIGNEGETQALLYATTIRARVKPVPLEPGDGLRVDVVLNRAVYHEGDEVRVAVTPSRDAYVYILNVAQDDSVTILFPNKFAQGNLVKAHRRMAFPSEAQHNMGVRLRAMLPSGERKAVEKVKVLASLEPLAFRNGSKQDGVFAVHQGRDRLMVIDLMKQLAMLDGAAWAEATIPYEIRP